MTTTPQMGKLVFCILLAPLLTLQTTKAEDLFTVYQHAKESDPQISAAEAGYLSTLEKLPQALAGLKSNVTLSGSATYKLSNSTTSFVTMTYSTT